MISASSGIADYQSWSVCYNWRSETEAEIQEDMRTAYGGTEPKKSF